MASKPSPQQRADLRTCASCEWVWRRSLQGDSCPLCNFGSYGARYVHGEKAREYERTQGPWLKRKLAEHNVELQRVIRKSMETRDAALRNLDRRGLNRKLMEQSGGPFL
jgi:hypothetical protein